MTSCPSMPKNYTVKEVADILGYSTNSIYAFLKEKRIRGVRLGKGRFRIPEEELARILHLSKRPVETAGKVQTVVAPSTPPVSAGNEISQSALISHITRWTKKHDWNLVAAPNIFDWLVGLGAIVSGASLFLFNLTNTAGDASLSAYLITARVALIAIGAGIVTINIFQGMRKWRSVFFGLLALLAFGSVMPFINVQDFDGAILYGTMGIVVLYNAIFDVDGIISYLLYLDLLLTGVVTLLFLGANVGHVQMFTSLFSLPNYAVALLLTGVAGTNLFLFWRGYRTGSVWFRIGAWVTMCFCFVAALWYANMEYWSRAMYFVVLGFFSLVVPLWSMLIRGHDSRRDKTILHIFLGLVSVVILASIFAVYELQQTLWNQKQVELHNKMIIAQRLVQDAFDTAQAVLATAAVNQDLVVAVGKKDFTTIDKYAKVLYESHSYLRRIIILDAEGKGVALYPYGTFDQSNLSFRDYFIAARNTRKPYVSGVFEALADNSHRQVVTVSVPLISTKNDFVGVLAGSIDINQLNLEVQQIADQTRGEGFTIVDRKGQYVISSNMAMVGKELPKDDPMRLYLNDTTPHASESIVFNDHMGVDGYNIVPNLGWSLSLRIPIGSVVMINTASVISLFAIILVVLTLGTSAFYYLYVRPKVVGGGSP